MRVLRFALMVVVVVYALEYIRTYWPNFNFKPPMPPPPWEFFGDMGDFMRKEADRLMKEFENAGQRADEFRRKMEKQTLGAAEEKKKEAEQQLGRIHDQVKKTEEKLRPKLPGH
jgi:hypothetical protein